MQLWIVCFFSLGQQSKYVSEYAFPFFRAENAVCLTSLFKKPKSGFGFRLPYARLGAYVRCAAPAQEM